MTGIKQEAGNGLEPKSLRKIFVGGLNLRTTEDTFREYFSQFGELVGRKEECVLFTHHLNFE